MSPTLTADQTTALNTKSHIFVEAGAGSGKTRILVERYLEILNQNPDLDLNSIIAFTFTQKAAQEMMVRIQETIETKTDSTPGSPYRFSSELREKITNDLHMAPISTIHQFCLKCLKAYPLEANLDPDIALLDPLHAAYLFGQAINETVAEHIQQETPLLRRLLEHSTLSQLKKEVRTLSNHAAFLTEETLETQPKKTLEEIHGSEHEGITKAAISYTKDLHTLYKACEKTYQQKKDHYGKCDFEDLIHRTITLIEKHPSVRRELQKRHKFLMVDEFQDTDPLQWQLILALMGGTSPETFKINLFLVGDLKQSIYSFRGATADLFTSVQAQFRKFPSHAQVISLKDNFRSHTSLMTSFNALFPPIFDHNTDTPISYQALTGHHKAQNSGTLHPIFLEGTHTFTDEVHTMAAWIQNHRQKNPATPLDDFAILFRRKANMESAKKLLDSLGLPTQILSQQSLYQNQAIIDLFSTLKALVHPQDNLAWRTLLRSPLFGWTEADVYTLFKANTHHTIPHQLLAPPEHLSEEEKQLWQHAGKLLSSSLQKAKHEPLSQCLEALLTQTGAWAIYGGLSNGEATCQMIDAFLKKCRELEAELALSPLDILDILEESIKQGEREKEQSNLKKAGHIALLSIHGSKGLEFPIVLLPECGKSFNFSSMQRLLFSPDLGPGFALKKGSLENKHRTKVLAHLKALTIEEEKRLFYVACTRAINHLVWVGHYAPDKIKPNSYLGFLSQIGTLEQGKFTTDLDLPGLTHPNTIQLATPHKQPKEKNQLSLFEAQLTPPISPKKPAIAPLTDPIASQRLTPQFLGTLSHQALQKSILFPDLPVDKIALDILHQNTLPDAIIPNTKSHIIRHLGVFRNHPLMTELLQAETVETERPFTYKHNGSLIKGRIDLLFNCGEKLLIIDFKTSRNTPAEYAQNLPTYKEQLYRYAQAIAPTLPKITQVQTIILQTHLNMTESWTYTRSELQ